MNRRPSHWGGDSSCHTCSACQIGHVDTPGFLRASVVNCCRCLLFGRTHPASRYLEPPVSDPAAIPIRAPSNRFRCVNARTASAGVYCKISMSLG